MAFQPGEGWASSGWAENCGISLWTLDRLDCSPPPRCLPIIGSGWVVNCEEQLFTLAWVCCDDEAIPGTPGHGGYLLKKKLFKKYRKRKRLKKKRVLKKEYIARLGRRILEIKGYEVEIPAEEIPNIPDLSVLEDLIPLDDIKDKVTREIAAYMRADALLEIDEFVEKMDWLEMEMYFMLLALGDGDF